MGEFSFKGVQTWSQSKISLLFCVWFESRELGSRGSSRFFCVTPVVETFSDRVTFRILPNISDGAPLRKQPAVLTLISCCKAFSQSNWHLSSFPSVQCFAFFLRIWIFFILSFVWHSLNLSVSFCRNSEAVVWRCSVRKVFLERTSGGCFWKFHYDNR